MMCRHKSADLRQARRGAYSLPQVSRSSCLMSPGGQTGRGRFITVNDLWTHRIGQTTATAEHGIATRPTGMVSRRSRQHWRCGHHHGQQGTNYVPQRGRRVLDRLDAVRGHGPAARPRVSHHQRTQPPGNRESHGSSLAGWRGRRAGEPQLAHRQKRDGPTD